MAKEINIKALNAYKEILNILNKTHLSNVDVICMLQDIRNNYIDNHTFDGGAK